MGITADLAEWAACWSGDSASAVARARASDALRDTIGCMVAGAGDIAADKARAVIAPWSTGGDATVIGWARKSSAPFAAFANAVTAHALEYDDTVGHALTHPSSVMFPALLALGEQYDRSCDALLSAWMVGLEIQIALGQAINREHYDSGWHCTSTVGLIGAAAACGRLLELDPIRMTAALSLATSMTSGSKGQFGTMAKPLHAALAAKAAIFAAVMACEGLTATADPLEGEFGFLRLYCSKGWRSFEPILKRLGAPLAIEWQGLDVKPYPCCSSMHPALDGFADLQSEHGFAAAAVTQATATIGFGPSLALIAADPKDEIEARFSLPYAAAALLIGKRLRLADFTDESFARPAVQSLLKRIQMKTWPVAEQPPGHPVPSEVVVMLDDGRRLSKRVAQVRGTLARPMSPDDCADKFEDCAQGLLPDRQFSALRRLLSACDGPLPVRQLTAQLAFEAQVDRGNRFLNRRRADTIPAKSAPQLSVAT